MLKATRTEVPAFRHHRQFIIISPRWFLPPDFIRDRQIGRIKVAPTNEMVSRFGFRLISVPARAAKTAQSRNH